MDIKERHEWIKNAHEAAQFINEIYAEKLMAAGITIITEVSTHAFNDGFIRARLLVYVYKGTNTLRVIYKQGSPIDTARLILKIEDLYERITSNEE